MIAIRIGRMVRAKGFDTRITIYGGCASACTLIWLSGRHAIVQRNSLLGFHAASLNGQYSPEGTAIVADYLREIGMTAGQIDYMTSAAPSDVQWATEGDALALGFRVQVVPSLGGWNSCNWRFCLAIP